MLAHRRSVALLSACALACGSSSKEVSSSPDSGTSTSGEGGGTGNPGHPGGSDAAALDAAGSPAVDGGFAADASLPSGRSFPDTFKTVAILADQFPAMNPAQLAFAAAHYVGTQKQLLPVTQALRAANPNFLVLHYHLAMWQSAPMVDFIVDGTSWGNDYPIVTANEGWFWHNAGGQRVPSSANQKLLMNVSVPAFQAYWATSLAAQVKAGDYDAIFFDSASPALLQGECSGTNPRLAGTAARDTSFAELGNTTWIGAWQAWMTSLAAALAGKGIPLIPNTGAFITGWDNTNYGLTAGIFSEGFADTSFAESDWQASTNELLTLAAADKVVLLQNYLSSANDVATRMYYLGNYLLVKGHHTYLDYFATSPLEWYPEWGIDLGEPTTPATMKVSDLSKNGLYRRDFANGSVLVNPSSTDVMVPLGGMFHQVVPAGGGGVDSNGTASGSLGMNAVTEVVVGKTSAVVLLL